MLQNSTSIYNHHYYGTQLKRRKTFFLHIEYFSLFQHLRRHTLLKIEKYNRNLDCASMIVCVWSICEGVRKEKRRKWMRMPLYRHIMHMYRRMEPFSATHWEFGAQSSVGRFQAIPKAEHLFFSCVYRNNIFLGIAVKISTFRHELPLLLFTSIFPRCWNIVAKRPRLARECSLLQLEIA